METRKGPYRTIAALRQAHPRFFARRTMKFFDSRVESGVYDGRYFITSEQFHGSLGSQARRYTIRVACEDTSIKTWGGVRGWQAFACVEDARAFLRAAVRAEGTCPILSMRVMDLWDAVHATAETDLSE